jgi:hypothetical protein
MNHVTIFWTAAALMLVTGCQTAEQNAQSELKRGIELLDGDELDGAIEAFNQAIQSKPDFSEAYFRRGLARSAKREFAIAIVDHQDAIRMKPGYAPYVFARGLAYLGDQQFDEAAKDFNQIRQLSPGAQLLAKTDEMLRMTAQSKEARGSTAIVSTVVNESSEVLLGKTWVQHGFLGRSTYFTNYPVWTIIVYLVAHLLAVQVVLICLVTALDGIGRHLTAGERSVVTFFSLAVGAGFYFLAWGYSYWGLWILCVVWTLGIGGSVIKAAATMGRS